MQQWLHVRADVDTVDRRPALFTATASCMLRGFRQKPLARGTVMSGIDVDADESAG